MAEEIYPTWLEGHIKRYEHKRLPTVTLCSSSVVCNEFEHINAMKTDPLAKI